MKRKTKLNIYEIVLDKKELNYTAIKDIRYLFRIEKKTEAIKDRILRELRDIKNLFEHEEGSKRK